MGKSFLTGGYKGGNSKPIYPSGKSVGAPPTGGLNKKIPSKQVPIKNTGKVAGGPNYSAKSEQDRDHPTVIKALGEMTRNYK